jgi:hypothetical protein
MAQMAEHMPRSTSTRLSSHPSKAKEKNKAYQGPESRGQSSGTDRVGVWKSQGQLGEPDNSEGPVTHW